ncbi:uncharacterized protein [Chiloscyllium punctatum]|uniref:uncharacterized protein n=1 Tax=Chiloscyllium punctatum TaxID=137246 RepID=UPI003B63DDD0
MNHIACSCLHLLLMLLWMPNIFEMGQALCRNVVSKAWVTCGNSVVLPCQAPGVAEPTSIIWQKESTGGDLVVHGQPEDSMGNRQSAWYKNRTMLDPNHNLTLWNAKLNDSGTYLCFVRSNPQQKSKLCSMVSLDVSQDTNVFWAVRSEVRAKHGEELSLHWGLNLHCITTENLGVNCGIHNSTEQRRFELRRAGAAGGARSEHPVLILEEADGLASFRVPGFSFRWPGGAIECCLDNGGKEVCARARVNIMGSTNSTGSTHRGRHQLLTLLLLTFVMVIL